jgi:hypothetical protein
MKELRKTTKNLVQSSKPLTVDCESKRITVALSLSVVTVLKVRFQVLTAASMKTKVYRRFRGDCCSYYQLLKKDSAPWNL